MPPLKTKSNEPAKNTQDVTAIGGALGEFVRVEKKVTKRIGEYESATMTICVQVHRDATDEEIDDALETAKAVNVRIDKVLVREVGKLLDSYGD